MKRLLLLAMVLTALPAQADLKQGEWKTARPILLPAATKPGLAYLPLDEEALAAQSLAEYRVVAEGRTEVPYRMVLEEGRTEARLVPVKVLSQGLLGKEKSQIALDLGPNTPSINQLKFSLKGDNFRCRVQVEASSDENLWWKIVDDGLIYRHEGKFEKISVSIPSRQDRFFRVTLARLQGDLPQVEEVQAIHEFTPPRQLVAVPAGMTRREDSKRRRTLLEFDLGRPSRDLVEAKFEVKQAAFDRPLEVEITLDNKDWLPAGEGRLQRLKADGEVSLPLQMGYARKARIIIENGDDRPLTIPKVTLWRARRGLIFSAVPAWKYELWYGLPGAAQPEYEIQRLPLTVALANLPQASLGPARKLPLKPPPPPPWSERHPALFWVALTGAILLLALLVVRTMQKVKTDQNTE